VIREDGQAHAAEECAEALRRGYHWDRDAPGAETLREAADLLDALLADRGELQRRAEDAEAGYDALGERFNGLRERVVSADAALAAARERETRLREALDGACDVAVWLSALVPHDGEAWETWEKQMRPELFGALAVLGDVPPPQREEGT
jgi:chromosome segregation ATPase